MPSRGAMLLAACLPAAIFTIAAGALAEEPPGAAAARHLLGSVPDKLATRACFVRAYDTAHLAAHPQQKVTMMTLLVSGENDDEDGQMNYRVLLGVRLRHKAARYTSAADCGHAKIGESGGSITLSCGVDCDGGGIDIALAKDDKSTLVSLEQIAIWRDGIEDENARTSLKSGTDDRSFRLERTRLADCLPLITDKNEAAAIRRQK